MNVKEVVLNEKTVLVFDAPENATHAKVAFNVGARYNISRKNKVMDTHVFDGSNVDSELERKYENKIVNIGMLKIADESLVADLFTPVKNGHFYDYEYNGIFYPKAVDALKDILEQETGYKNPFVLVIK